MPHQHGSSGYGVLTLPESWSVSELPLTDHRGSQAPSRGFQGPYEPGSDPRWEWIEVTQLGGQSIWVKTKCNHLERERIYAADIHVATLCLTCNETWYTSWVSEGR